MLLQLQIQLAGICLLVALSVLEGGAGREEGRSKTGEGQRERGKHVWLEGKGAAQAAKPEEALATLPCSQASRPEGPRQQERPQGAAAAPGAPAAALGTQQLGSPCSLATGCWSRLPLHARAKDCPIGQEARPYERSRQRH